MEIFAGLSVLLLILVAASIAIKTFSLWLRTRSRPELLLGLYLTCATAIGYPLAIAMNQIPASENRLLHVVAELVMSSGWICLLLFTLSVFRPNVLWARLLVGVAAAGVVAIGAAYIVEAMAANPRAPEEMPRFILLNSVPVAFAYFWATFESLSYYGRLRLRLRLGLADAAVANRVLLWGIMTLAAGTALVINMAVLAATGSYMSPGVVLASSAFGLVHASCLFLAFHPPGWYVTWLDRRYAESR